MTFFARPNLSDEQFKQLSGTVLKLSGQTQVTTTSGLTLSDGAGGSIIITADEAPIRSGEVLTYDGAGKIKLMPSSGSGGDPTYNPPYKSPASVNLCGIAQGFILTGKTLSCIIETLLVPTLNPSLTPPSFSFGFLPSNLLYEVGAKITTLTATNEIFTRGSISPQYTSASPYRSGPLTSYNYTVFGSPVTSPTSGAVLASNYTIQIGNNTVSGVAAYSGGVQPKNSSNGNYDSPLGAGVTTPAQSTIIYGTYPWFWGSSPTPPVVGQALINSGNKCVQGSTNSIVVDNYNVSGKYIWFAVPYNAPTTKTKWQGGNTAENKGVIPAVGGLFQSAPTTTLINSPSSCWSNINYQFYISGYATSINYSMTYSA